MAIQLCPVDTANVHPRNILGSSSSFDRERPLATPEKNKVLANAVVGQNPQLGFQVPGLIVGFADPGRGPLMPVCQCAITPFHHPTIVPSTLIRLDS